MDTKTREALEASIKHWQENVDACTPEQASVRAEDCALCLAFDECDCSGCPVSARTKMPCCDGSPYDSAYHALQVWKRGGSRVGWDEAAQAELDFMISLRPEVEA